MPTAPPTLHMLCGKIAAGKSTLADKLASEVGTVLIVEDQWLGALFSDQMSTGADYMRCAARLRTVIVPHVEALLAAGVSVVLDFPANTAEQRAWMRGILDRTGVAHELHLLDVPDEVCLARLARRNARGDHPFAVTEAMFHRFSAFFEPPLPDEGFEITRHATPG